MDSGKTGVVLVAGVGEGLGLAVSRRFARAGYTVAMAARKEDKLRGFVDIIDAEGGTALACPIDVRDEARVSALIESLETRHGPLEAAVYNAGAQFRDGVLETASAMFEKVWRLGCLGGFITGREVLRRMAPRRRGTLIFTGATASLRGGKDFAAFAAAKAGLRAVAQSMAREFGPQGIHVAHVVIDGVIDSPATRSRFPDFVTGLPEDGLLKPDDIAEAYFHLHAQPKSAWTLELDVRPWVEKF